MNIEKVYKLVKSTKGCKNPRINVLGKCQKLETQGWKHRDGSYSSNIVCSGDSCLAWMVKGQ